MKIGFAVWKAKDGTDTPEIARVVYDWKSLLECKANGLCICSRQFYSMVKALSYNPVFCEAILKTRKQLKIPPEGFSLVEYRKFSTLGKDSLAGAVLDQYSNTSETARHQVVDQVYSKIYAIEEGHDLPWIVAQQLATIVKFNFVEPALDDSLYCSCQSSAPEDEDEPINFISINIRQPVTFNAFIRYAKVSWPEIEKHMQRLLPDNAPTISDRDFEIVHLRETKKLSFEQIASQINSLYPHDDPDDEMNQDSVKTAYKRAKDNIDSLYSSN